MQNWHTTYLGLKTLPRELSAFELQTFFTFSKAEREVIETRYGATNKLGLALHMGFLRLSGRSLNALRVVPVALWAHLGEELGVRPPEIASLKTLYGRRSTLFEHQQLAQQTLGFRGITDHQRRAFVQTLRDEVTLLGDKDHCKRSTNPRLTNHCQLRQACAITTQMEKRTCKHDQPHLRNTLQRPGAKESPWPHMPKHMASQPQPCTAGNKSCARAKPLQLTQLP